VVHADGLRNLEEPDQLEPVQALGAGLVAVDLQQPRVHRRVSGMSPLMWANRKNPRTPCIIVLIEDAISPDSPSPRMYSSTCARWIPTSGSKALC
jgi:hypothetical protein